MHGSENVSNVHNVNSSLSISQWPPTNNGLMAYFGYMNHKEFLSIFLFSISLNLLIDR